MKFAVSFCTTTAIAKSEANMWNILRGIRDSLKTADFNGEKDYPHHATAWELPADFNGEALSDIVPDEKTGEFPTVLFKDIVFHLNSRGKIEMVNLIKGTCRKARTAARKAAKEKAEKEAARKARKAEANRRYRAKKKAAAEALKAAAAKTEKIEQK